MSIELMSILDEDSICETKSMLPSDTAARNSLLLSDE